MTTLVFTLEIAQEYYNSTEDFPVPFDAAWQYVGYSNKSNAKRSFKSSGLVENVDWVFLNHDENSAQTGLQGGRPSENIYLSVDGFKLSI